MMNAVMDVALGVWGAETERQRRGRGFATDSGDADREGALIGDTEEFYEGPRTRNDNPDALGCSTVLAYRDVSRIFDRPRCDDRRQEVVPEPTGVVRADHHGEVKKRDEEGGRRTVGQADYDVDCCTAVNVRR